MAEMIEVNMRTYEEVLRDAADAYGSVFYDGYRDIRGDLVAAAAKIYIAEFEADKYKKTKENLF